MDVLKKVPVREQDPKVRATNFEEVCLGYNKEEAMEEASRCLKCKNARCMKGCPVSIQIPDFIAAVKDGDIEKAYEVISESSALPAVCGRVCPQESQCESACTRGFRGDPVGIVDRRAQKANAQPFRLGGQTNVLRRQHRVDRSA